MSAAATSTATGAGTAPQPARRAAASKRPALGASAQYHQLLPATGPAAASTGGATGQHGAAAVFGAEGSSAAANSAAGSAASTATDAAMRAGTAPSSMMAAGSNSSVWSGLGVGGAGGTFAGGLDGVHQRIPGAYQDISSDAGSTSSATDATAGSAVGHMRTRGRLGSTQQVSRKRGSNRRVRGDTGYLTEVITFAARRTYGDGLQLETSTAQGHFLLAFNNRILRSKGVRPWRIAEWRAATRKLATHQIRKDRSSTEILFRCRSLLEATGNKYEVANVVLRLCSGQTVRGFRSDRMTEVAADLPELALSDLGPPSKRARVQDTAMGGGSFSGPSAFAGL